MSLGLLISNKLASALNNNEGGIHLRSKPNIGSVFSFKLYDFSSDHLSSRLSKSTSMEESSYNSPIKEKLIKQNSKKSDSEYVLSEYEVKLLRTLKKGSLDEIIEQNTKYTREGALTKFGVSLNVESKKWRKKINSYNELISSKINLIQEIMKERTCSCPIALIIDGDDFNIYILRLMLKNLLIPSDSFLSGADAIKKIVNFLQNECCNYYKLILLDLNLPIKTGLEILDEIKQLYFEAGLPSLNVIAVSGLPQENQIVQDALSKGAKGFLMKPISQEAIVSKIKEEWFQ